MPTLSHRYAVPTMMTAAPSWSLAGVVARQLDSASGHEMTCWRRAFNALAPAPAPPMLGACHGPRRMWAVRGRGAPVASA